jgi:hypothetical protein
VKRQLQGSTVRWWEWQREETLLKKWVRIVMGERACEISYKEGSGSYMCFDPAQVVVDPTFADRIGGKRLLPFCWRGVQVTRLEQLQKLISRMHARHEGGHWEVTTPYTVLGETHEWLANALEDERMERLIAKRFRGAGADFRTYARLFALHVIPDRCQAHSCPSRVDALLNACLGFRWCAKFPGSFTRFIFPDTLDRQFWEEQICPLVERAWLVPTSQEVSDIAAEILLRIGISSSELLAGHLLFPLSSVRKPTARAAYDLPLPYTGSGGAEENDSPDENALSEAPEGDEEEAQMDVDPSEGKLWARPYLPLVGRVQPVALRLRQRLKLPAPDVEVRRVPTGGRYSVRAAIRTQGRQPHVSKREESYAPQGMRVILLIDHTASMGGSPGKIHPVTFEPEASFFAEWHRMTHARRVAMTLELACTSVGIPLCIGVAGGTYGAVHLLGSLNQIVAIAPEGAVIWLRTWSTPPFAEGPKALIAGLYGTGADELVSSALIEACAQFRELEADGDAVDLLLYLNDYEVDEPPEQIQRQLQTLRAGGTLIFSIYTGDQDCLEEVERMFGKQWTIAVPNLGRLPEQVSAIMALVRQGRWRPAHRR